MKQHAKIRAELERKLAELTARVDSIDEDLSAPPDEDWDDNAIESEGDEVLDRVGTIALQEMRHVKLALSRIDAGKYGTCISCGDPISAERLEALPETSKCVGCS